MGTFLFLLCLLRDSKMQKTGKKMIGGLTCKSIKTRLLDCHTRDCKKGSEERQQLIQTARR